MAHHAGIEPRLMDICAGSRVDSKGLAIIEQLMTGADMQPRQGT